MPKIIFEDASGKQQAIEAEVGSSVMQVAVDAQINGILADCGGGCSCATCHCYVDKGIFSEPDDIESEMLECVLEPQENSRLSCQLIVDSAMDGVIIKLPSSQV